MARIKSKKYTGLYLNQLKDGDITYYVTYKDKYGKKVFHQLMELNLSLIKNTV